MPKSSGWNLIHITQAPHEEAEVLRHIHCQPLPLFQWAPFASGTPVTRRDSGTQQHLLFSGSGLDLEVELGSFFPEVLEESLVMTFMTNQQFYLRLCIPMDEKTVEVI